MSMRVGERSIPFETAAGAVVRPVFGAAAEPVAFSGMAGVFTPAAEPGDLAALFVGPWGLEEMSTRKFWRIVAERLAAQGVASLRFDLPGTGDSLDPPSGDEGLCLWERAVLQAADQLSRRSGARRIVLVGQGLGAALAMRVSARLEGLAGMALLAPVVSGRFHLREIGAMSRMVDDSLGLAEDQRQSGGVAIAGLRMPDAIAADCRKLDLMALEAAPPAPCLVVRRAARPADGEFATYLSALGAAVDTLDFDGYEALTANPAVSKVPEDVAARIGGWIASLRGPAANRPAALPPGLLDGGHFCETPVRFGGETPLYGMLCEPAGPREGAAVVFLTSAYDRHAGWGRSTARMARELAGRGIASLRFDAANVADSPPRPGVPGQVLYSEAQARDVADALDFLAGRLPGPVILAGRCSGAYLAFRAAVADPRVGGAVAVNPFTFHWQPGRDVDAALRTVPRALCDYGQRALQWSTVRRLLSGEVDVRNALANIAVSIARRLSAPLLLHLRPYGEEGRAVHAAFRALRERGAGLTLVYSEHDVGWGHFSAHFGPCGERLAAYGNVQLCVIADADHNLTPEHARRTYADEVEALARRVAG